MTTHSTTQEQPTTPPALTPTRQADQPDHARPPTASRREPEKLADRDFAATFKPMSARPTFSAVLDALL